MIFTARTQYILLIPAIAGVLLWSSFSFAQQSTSDALSNCTSKYPNKDTDPVQKVGYDMCAADAQKQGSGVTPTLVGFNRDGVFGCAGIGRYGSVGLAHAGGTYVPVSEEAISLNTHILVNKECVLDGLAAEQRKAVMAGLTRAGVQAINRGRNGKPLYSQGRNMDIRDKRRIDAARFLEDPSLNNICKPYRDGVKRALAQNFYDQSEQPEKQYTCSFPGTEQDMQDFLNGKVTSYDQIFAMGRPENSFLGSYFGAQEVMDGIIESNKEEMLKELEWGQGYHSTKECEKVPIGNGDFEEQCFIVTPGKISADLATYFSQVGLNQTAQADEISELIEPLAANISTQALSSFGGFNGLSQQRSGNPSYLDSSAQTAFNNAQLETTSAGIEVLVQALKMEQLYVDLRTSSKSQLEAAAKKIADMEKACYDKLVAQAQTDTKKELNDQLCGAQSSDTTNFNAGSSCTVDVTVKATEVKDPKSTTDSPRSFIVIDARGGGQKKIVTISRNVEHSSDVVGSSIKAVLDVVTSSLEKGKRALDVLQQLQQSLQANNNATMVRYVLEQFSQLVSARAIHSSTDISEAKDQQVKISEVMQNLVDDTKDEWEKGWCKPENWKQLIVPTPSSYLTQNP